jgi:lipopolysaccharide transport system permease protein
MRSLFQYRELIHNLVLKNLKLKYRDSVLGFVWVFVKRLHLVFFRASSLTFCFAVDPAKYPFYYYVGVLCGIPYTVTHIDERV